MRSTVHKFIELSRGVVRVKSYGESKSRSGGEAVGLRLGAHRHSWLALRLTALTEHCGRSLALILTQIPSQYGSVQKETADSNQPLAS